MDFTILIIALVCALVIMFAAYLADQDSARKRASAMTAAPHRPVLADHAGVTYVTEDQIRQEAAKHQPTDHEDDDLGLRVDLAAANPLPAGLASNRFALRAPSGRGTATRPLIMVCEKASRFDDLYPLIAAAQREHRSIVVVANEFASEVIATLVANAESRHLACLAILAKDASTLTVIADQCAAQVVSAPDLRSGYIPEASLGHCELWIADTTSSWILDSSSVEE